MATPLFMRNVHLTLKLTAGSRIQFNCDAKVAEIVSEAGDEVEYKTLCATGSFKQVGVTTYALHLVAMQDWATNGLARFLWDNDGASAEFQYSASSTIPPTTAAPGMSGFVTLVAPNYGGEVETYAELDVTLPCTAKPTIVTAAFPVLAEEEAPAEGAAA